MYTRTLAVALGL